MIVTCPECTTRYRIQPEDLGALGRYVHCNKCDHKWLEFPTETVVEMDGDVTPSPETPDPIPEDSNVPAVPKKGRFAFFKRVSPMGYGMAAAFILMVSSAVTLFLLDKANVPALKFQDVHIDAVQKENHTTVIAIQGSVMNVSKKEKELPAVLVTIEDAEHHVLYEKPHPLPETVLAAGNNVSFHISHILEGVDHGKLKLVLSE